VSGEDTELTVLAEARALLITEDPAKMLDIVEDLADTLAATCAELDDVRRERNELRAQVERLENLPSGERARLAMEMVQAQLRHALEHITYLERQRDADAQRFAAIVRLAGDD
jgi:hypothetical protein